MKTKIHLSRYCTSVTFPLGSPPPKKKNTFLADMSAKAFNPNPLRAFGLNGHMGKNFSFFHV